MVLTSSSLCYLDFVLINSGNDGGFRRQVVWLSDVDRAKGYAVDFLSLSLHAVSRDPEAYPSPCIYTQVWYCLSLSFYGDFNGYVMILVWAYMVQNVLSSLKCFLSVYLVKKIIDHDLPWLFSQYILLNKYEEALKLSISCFIAICSPFWLKHQSVFLSFILNCDSLFRV